MGAASAPTKHAYNTMYIFCLRSDLYIIMAEFKTEVVSWHLCGMRQMCFAVDAICCSIAPRKLILSHKSNQKMLEKHT